MNYRELIQTPVNPVPLRALRDYRGPDGADRELSLVERRIAALRWLRTHPPKPKGRP